MNCPNCGKEVSSLRENCPHCGFPLKLASRLDSSISRQVKPIPSPKAQQDAQQVPTVKLKIKPWIIILFLVLDLLIFGAVLFFLLIKNS